LKIISQEQARDALLAQERVDMGLSRNEDATTQNSKRGAK